ncbi:MAG: ABC transporter ATP-binding protein [Mesorhizobium sp.]|nr:MAG: ABC transporter ATP-binding protein [Mesorhizobium sp.]
MSKAAEIDIVSVSKVYGATTAVEGISLKIPAGTYCCLLGPSGCGKTSTLRMIAGHESISSGDVRLGNTVVTHLPPARRGTAMMFQSYALFPHLDLIDNVAFSLKMKGVGKEERRAKALDMLKKLQTSLGITFVHVTHSQEEAMALADLIVVMNDGRIEQAAHPRIVFERPATAFVARFMGDHNVISGRVTGSRDGMVVFDVPGGVTLATSGQDRETGEPIDIAIRTDHVRIGDPPAAGLGFTGIVSNVEYRGSTVKLSVNGAGIDDFTVIVDDTSFFARPVAVGDAVPIAWDAEDAIVLGRLDS